MTSRLYLCLGWYWHRKVQRRVQTVGALTAARQLRKQGVSHRVARLLVAYRPLPVLTERPPDGVWIVRREG